MLLINNQKLFKAIIYVLPFQFLSSFSFASKNFEISYYSHKCTTSWNKKCIQRFALCMCSHLHKKVLFTIKCFWKFCHGKCHIFTQTFIMFNCPWNRLISKNVLSWVNEYTCLHERTNINDGFYHKWPPFYENNWTGTDNDGSNTKLSYRLSQQVGQNILIQCFTVLMK